MKTLMMMEGVCVCEKTWGRKKVNY